MGPPRTERRRFVRERKRIACSVTWRGATSAGWVRDWSANGLAIQAQVRPRLGDAVDIELRADRGEPVRLTAMVVRVERSHPSAQPVAPPTLGLQISNAPEAYFRMLLGEA